MRKAFNLTKKDEDVLIHLAKQENISRYIIKLIRKDIAQTEELQNNLEIKKENAPDKSIKINIYLGIKNTLLVKGYNMVHITCRFTNKCMQRSHIKCLSKK